MAAFSKLQEYHPETENIVVYLERVQLYFEVNAVREGKRMVIFLSSLGATTYALRHILSPAKPQDKT